MGGSRAPSTQTTRTELPAYMQPVAQRYLQRAEDLSARPFEQYQGQRIAGIDPVTQTGISGIESTARGDYLGSNPYIDKQYGAAARNVADVYKYATAPSTAAAASRAGALGGSAYNELQQQQQYGLGQNLSNLAANMYGGAYETERGRQQQAMMGALGAGDIRRQYEQSQLADAQNRWQEQYMHPYRQLDVLGGALSGSMGGQSQTTQTMQQRSNPMMGMLGMGLAGASLFGGGPVLGGLGALGGGLF